MVVDQVKPQLVLSLSQQQPFLEQSTANQLPINSLALHCEESGTLLPNVMPANIASLRLKQINRTFTLIIKQYMYKETKWTFVGHGLVFYYSMRRIKRQSGIESRSS
jgi:hypothetical protein